MTDLLTKEAQPSLIFCLSSGVELVATAVMLYPSTELAKVAQLTANAHEELKGVNLGVGFIGSPEWAIGGGLAVGLIGGLMANSKAKKGVALLQEAAKLQDAILDMGVLFTPESIKNIERPFPSGWSGQHFSGKPKIPTGYVVPISSNSASDYTALGNDLAIFEVDGKELWIRMSTVTTYRVVGINVSPSPRARHEPVGEGVGASKFAAFGPRVLR